MTVGRDCSVFWWLIALTCIEFGLGNMLGSEPQKSTRADYEYIIQRNAFNLIPPLQPPIGPGPTLPPTIVPEINITGISTINNIKRVYLMIPPSKEVPETRYMTLREGDLQNGVSIVSINEKSDEVVIRNTGQEETLSFASHGVKAAAAPTPKKSS